MRRSKIAGFTVCAVSAVMLLSGFDSAMTAESLYQKVQENASSVSSGSMTGSFSADAALQIGADASTAATMQMSGDVSFTASFNTEPYTVMLQADYSGSAMGQSAEGSVQEYLVTEDDGTGTAYYYIDNAAAGTEDSGSGWTAQKMDAEQMKKTQDAISAIQSGDYSSLKDLGVDYESLQQKFLGASVLAPSAITVSGQECYELQTSLTGEVISGLFNDILNSGAVQGSDQLDEQSQQILNMMTQSIQADVKTDYSTESFLPVHGEFDLSKSDFSWFGDLIAQSSSASGDASQIPQMSVGINKLGGTVDYDFTTPVTIEVPEEAKNAPVMEAGQLQNELQTALQGTGEDAGAAEAVGDAAGTATDEATASGSGTEDTAVLEDENTPVPNADGTYTLTDTDLDDNTVSATITVPDGWKANYQSGTFFSISDDSYNSVDYMLTAYDTVDEIVSSVTDTQYYTADAGYSDVNVSGPDEITLSDGSAAKVVTVSYTFSGTKMGRVTAVMGEDNKAMRVERGFYAVQDEELVIPAADDMKIFCDSVKFDDDSAAQNGTDADGAGESFADAGIADGTYQFDGVLEGGTGRASFDGPLTLKVSGGAGALTFTMSSENYDYVIVNGQKYLPVNDSGNSTFTVPIDKVNCDFAFTGDTVAMSTPHEIDYTVRIDAAALAGGSGLIAEG